MNKDKIKKILFDVFIKYQGLVVLLIIIDQISKIIVMNTLEYNTPVKLFSWLNLTFVYNTGVAFSFLKDAPQWITACISIIAAVAIEAYLIIKKPKEKFLTILLLCLVAGAIGNGIDRWLAVFNARGGVVDFIDPTFFANFNVADIYVTCSCIAMVVYFLFSKEERDTTHIKKKEKTIKESDSSDNDLVFNDSKND